MSAIAGCAQSPLGRQQILFLPDSQVQQMGVEAFAKMKREVPTESNGQDEEYVRCVTSRLTSVLGGNAPRQWEVVIFRDDSANAFALPGGKIGVNTGMLSVAETPGELATVLAHEIGHVIANHTNERLSTQSLTEGALQILAGAGSSAESQQLMGLLGIGAQYGLLLPFNRAQESEADRIGLEIMARGGFDPRESVQLWRAMERKGGEEPPEFFSTHPSSGTRIAALQSAIPAVMPLYQQAIAGGHEPRCEARSRRR